MKNKGYKITIICFILFTLLLLYKLFTLASVLNYFVTEVVEVKCYNRAGDGSTKFYINVDDTLTFNDTGAWRSDRTTSVMTWELQNKCEIKRYFGGAKRNLLKFVYIKWK